MTDANTAHRPPERDGEGTVVNVRPTRWPVIAMALTAVGVATVEVGLVRVQHHTAWVDLWWMWIATVVLTAVALVPLAMMAIGAARVRGLRWCLAVARRHPMVSRAVAAALLVVAVVLHFINARYYVRLYMSVHLAISVATLGVAYAGVLLGLALQGRPTGTRNAVRISRPVAAAAVVAWVIVGVLAVRTIARGPRLRFVAMEQSTLLWHELWALNAATGVLELGAQDDSGAEVPSEILATLAPQVPAAVSGIARGADVVLLTVDSLRADRLGPGLPNIEQLRRESIEMTRAFAPGCNTVRSMSSILTSHYSSQLAMTFVSVAPGFVFTAHDLDSELVTNPLNRRKVREIPLRDSHPTLAGWLAKGGYQTATVSAYAFYLRAAGITREFEVVDEDGFRDAATDSMGIAPVDLVARARAVIAGRDPNRPLFLWLHFMEAHAPYTARDATAVGGTAEARYQSELREVDRQIGELRNSLRPNTLILLHADHGEEFGDHGAGFHGASLYQEISHVPWLLRLPTPVARQVSVPVTLVDLSPTVLDLVGVPVAAPMMGRSLVPLINGQEPPVRPIYMECMPAGRLLRAVVLWPFKFIVDEVRGTAQLYDLGKDPAEQRNVVEDVPEVSAAMRALLRDIQSRVLGAAPPR